jgi:hypothetical protein
MSPQIRDLALERAATRRLAAALDVIEQKGYFDGSANRPVIDPATQSIKLKIHLKIYQADKIGLTKGPHWSSARRHPYFKIEQTWVGDALVRYLYDLIDRGYDYEEGFHRHREADRKLHYHRQTRQGRKTTWLELPNETPLGDALDALIESMWRLRG